MNPDNPYAAPQTLQPQFAADEPLPVATLTGRQRYPEMETAQLLRLAKLSRAIESATTLWMYPLLALIGPALLYVVLGKPVVLILALCVYRLYAGAKRRTHDRIFIRCADSIFLAGMVAGAVGLCFEFWRDPLFSLFFLIVLGVLSWLLLDAIRATFSAQELFGPTPYLHRELVEEADYRREHLIV